MFDLDRILSRVTRPARYTGGEWNSIVKDWDSVDIRVALAYPDTYEIGMSNMGMTILYDILNEREDTLAERVFAPWPDMADRMREAKIPLYSLESKHPIGDFDIVGFSLNYELTYTNILEMLDLAGIPATSGERDDSAPLIIAGGSCALNPEPMCDFIDLFVIGEGEEVIVELVEAFRTWLRDRLCSRDEMLKEVSKLPGIYVPSLYHMDTTGVVKPSTEEAASVIKRRIVSQLPEPVTRMVVPFIEVTHDRGAVEIQRGCTRGCRFCQASVIYRPVRERSVPEVANAIEAIVDNCGYEEISLLSLSTSDYSGIGQLVKALDDKFRGMHLNISLPSLRPDAFSVQMAGLVKGQRKTSLTFAPEAGTARMRSVINKSVTQEDLFQAITVGLQAGWRSFKLYFMIGLPTEDEEDIAGIVDLVHRAREIRAPDGKKPNLRVNVSTFIPKSHTPFQWMGQCPEESLNLKHEILKRGIRKAGANFSWHDPKVSLLEGIMSRGDRRLGMVVHRAWQSGCRFDAWSDQFDFTVWNQAFEESGIDYMDFVRERSLDEPLPWGHIDSGVSLDYLKSEYERALKEEETPDCRFGECTACGLQRWHNTCERRFQVHKD